MPDLGGQAAGDPREAPDERSGPPETGLHREARSATPRRTGRASFPPLRWADGLHHEQKRASGEPFFMHPLSVAAILVDAHMDAQTVIAALLHDVLEDTEPDPPRAAQGVRQGGGGPGAGGDQDLPIRGHEQDRPAGRDHPQDALRHGQGHPGDPDQAGRQAAQHAHPRSTCEEDQPQAHRHRDASTSTRRWPGAWASRASRTSWRTCR